MNTNKLGSWRRVCVGAASIAASLMTPSAAYAAGADILLPKPAEFIPALIAFLAIWLILAKLAWPAIIKVLDAREEKINDDLSAAESSRVQAEASVEQAKEKVVEAEREAQEILAQAKRDAERERARILAEAQTSAQGIVAKAHDTVAAERKKAMIELSGQVVDLSVEIASKVIAGALDETQQRALAEKYLMEVGSLND